MSANVTCELPVQDAKRPGAPKQSYNEIRIRGKTVRVPSIVINNIHVLVTGKWLKVAAMQDEKLVGSETFEHPGLFIDGLKQAKAKADIFTFAQRLPETQPKYPYHFEWDNAAAIPITTYKDWFEKRAATDVKQNVKKSGKRGLVVRPAQFDDEFVRGIVAIYNESPVRQGRPFWHYGKDFATVKKETSHCLDKSEFIGAYYQDELVGFIKLLRGGGVADIVLIVSKQSHHDKKPTNALIAKAVEVCEQKGISYLTYARYTYGNKTNSSLVDFKQRNGFEPILFPRYYVPLTLKGRLAVKLRLYRDLKSLIPESVLKLLLRARATLVERVVIPLKSFLKSGKPQSS